MRLLSIVLLIVVFILCFAFIHQNMRLKGGADDMIDYYDFKNSIWVEGDTTETYNVSIKYNDATEVIAIEVEKVIKELIEKGVMDDGKIKRINIDVTTKNGEHKIGRNFKIYWSENNNMITVGCEYDGNCAAHRINKDFREANATRKEVDDAMEKAVADIKKLDDAMKETDVVGNALKYVNEKEDAEIFKLIPVTNPKTNINTNETGYAPLTEGMQQVYKQAYMDMEADHEELDKGINQLFDQAYMNIAADFEAVKNKSFNEENEVAKKIERLFNEYFDVYQTNDSGLPIAPFETYISTISINDKEKMLNYLEENPGYLNELIDDKEGVQWQVVQNGEHQLIATTIKGDDKTNSLNNTNLEMIDLIDEKKLVNEKLVERFKNTMNLTRQLKLEFSCLDANQEGWSNDEKEALKNDNIVNASFEAANVNHDFKLEHTRTCWKLSLIDTNLEMINPIENINELLENYYNYCKEHYENINDYRSLEEYLKNNGINVTDNIVVQYITEHLEEINKDFKEKHKDNVPPLELIREPDFNNEIFIGEVFHYP